jgi:predicted metal-binding membrane protein
MTPSNTAVAVPGPRLLWRAETSVLLVVAAVAWLATIMLARDMGVMPGTMGLSFLGFVGTWTLMMAAMMLTSIAPFAALYSRTMRDHRARRASSLAVGYLAVWAAAGVVAFACAAAADRLATNAPGWAQAAAVSTCALCGIYQLTPLKESCLRHCRSPLGHLLHYTSLRGPLTDLRVGLSHGAWCLACCWSLMVLLVTFGVMNLYAMVVLAGVIVMEKVVAPGRWFSTAIGLAAFAFGIAIWIDPSLAPGLHSSSNMVMGGM